MDELTAVLGELDSALSEVGPEVGLLDALGDLDDALGTVPDVPPELYASTGLRESMGGGMPTPDADPLSPGVAPEPPVPPPASDDEAAFRAQFEGGEPVQGIGPLALPRPEVLRAGIQAGQTPETVADPMETLAKTRQELPPAAPPDFAQFLARKFPWFGHGVSAAETAEAAFAMHRINKNEATPTDYETAAQWLNEQERRKNFSAKDQILDIATDLPRWWFEFGATAPIRTGVTSAFRSVMPGAMHRATGEAIAIGAGGAAQGLAQPMVASFAANELARQAMADEDPDFIRAIDVGALTSAIQGASEVSGGAFTKIPMPKQVEAIKKAIERRWLGTVAGRTVAEFDKTLAKGGWNGIIGEIGEERVAEVAEYATGLRSAADTVPTWKQVGIEAAAFSVPGAVRIGANAPIAAMGAISDRITANAQQRAEGAQQYASAYTDPDTGKTLYRDINDAANAAADALERSRVPLGSTALPSEPAYSYIAPKPAPRAPRAPRPQTPREPTLKERMMTPEGVQAFIQSDPIGARELATNLKATTSKNWTKLFGIARGQIDELPPEMRWSERERQDFARMVRVELGQRTAAPTPPIGARDVRDEEEAQETPVLTQADLEETDVPTAPAEPSVPVGAARPVLMTEEEKARRAAIGADMRARENATTYEELKNLNEPPAAEPPPKIGAKKPRKPQREARLGLSQAEKKMRELTEKYAEQISGFMDDTLSEESKMEDTGPEAVPGLYGLNFADERNARDIADALRDELRMRGMDESEIRKRVRTVARPKIGQKKVPATGEDEVREYGGVPRVADAIIADWDTDARRKTQRTADWILANPFEVDPADLFEAKRYAEIRGTDLKATAKAARDARPVPKSVDELQPGDTFTIAGDSHEVVEIDPDTGAVVIKDGLNLELPPGYELRIDEGSFKEGEKADFEFPDNVPKVDDESPKIGAATAKKPREVGTVSVRVLENVEKMPDSECFRNAAKWAEKNDAPGMVVVHGKLTVNGTRFDHAWIVQGETVIDPTAGVKVPRVEWMKTTNAEEDATYAPDKAIVMAVRAKHWGPWTKEEAEGRYITHNAAAPANIEGRTRPSPKIGAAKPERGGLFGQPVKQGGAQKGLGLEFEEPAAPAKETARASDELVQEVANAIKAMPGKTIPSIEEIRDATNTFAPDAELQDAIDRAMKGVELFEEAEPETEGVGQGGGSEFIGRRKAAAPPPFQAGKKVKPIRTDEIIDRLENIWEVPIKIGGVKSKEARAVYEKVRGKKPGSRVLRMREEFADDMIALAHDLAHHIDRTTGIRNDIPMKLTGEVYQLDYDYPNQRRVTEGFAEFIRFWLSEGEASARAKAPNFAKWFEGWLKDNPTVAKKLRKTIPLFERFFGMTTEQRIDSWIVPTEKPVDTASIKDKGMRAVHRMANWWWDDKAAILDFTRDAEKIKQLAPGTDPYVKVRVYTHAASAMARDAIDKGVFSVMTGKKMGPALLDAVKKLDTKNSPLTWEKFDKAVKYWASRNAVERWDLRKKPTPEQTAARQPGDPAPRNPGIPRDVAAEYVATYENEPGFKEFADTATEFHKSLVEMVTEAGRLSEEDKQLIIDTMPMYAPLKRVIGDRIRMGEGIGQGIASQANPVKSMSELGSGRPVMNPFAETMRMVERFYLSAANAHVMSNLIQTGNEREGMGRWFSKLHTPPMDAMTTKIGNIRKDLEAGGADLTNADMEKLITVFMAAGFYHGDKPYVPHYEAGKLQWYEMHPDLYSAVKAISPYQLPKGIESTLPGKIATGATKLKRLGATELRPSFGALINPMRDVPAYLIRTKGFSPTAPVRLMTEFIRQMLEVGTAGKFGSKDPVLRVFNRFGGALSGYVGQDIEAAYRHAEDIVRTARGRQSVNALIHPVDTLRTIFSALEKLPRRAEARNTMLRLMQKHGYTKADMQAGNLPPVALQMEMMYNAQRVTTDFKQAGHAGRIMNKLHAYGNAKIQDIVTDARLFRDNPVRTLMRGFLWITVPALLHWWMVKDEEWYQKLPGWRKMTGFNFRIFDTPVWIPSPFLLGMVFAHLPVAVVDKAYRDDSESVNDWFKQMWDEYGVSFETLLGALDVFAPLLHAGFNRNWRGDPIVPKGKQDLKASEQYSDYNTSASKYTAWWLSSNDIAEVSPAKMDSLIGEYTGGLGTDIMRIPDEGVGRALGFGRVTRESTDRAVDQFYDERDRITTEYNSATIGDAEAPEEVRLAYQKIQKAAQLMTDIRNSPAEKEDRNKYTAGVARRALQMPTMETSPDPLATPLDDLPSEILPIVEKHWQTMLFHATQAPSDEMEQPIGQSDERFLERQAERDEEIRMAREALDNSPLSLDEKERLLEERAEKQGDSTDSDSFERRKERV